MAMGGGGGEGGGREEGEGGGRGRPQISNHLLALADVSFIKTVEGKTGPDC